MSHDNRRFVRYLITLVLAREDALRLRKLVANAHAKRQDVASSKNGPEPSQRSIDSLGTVGPFTSYDWSRRSHATIPISAQLVSFAENVSTCRHVVRPAFVYTQCASRIDVHPSLYAGTLVRSSTRRMRMLWRASVTRCATCVPFHRLQIFFWWMMCTVHSAVMHSLGMQVPGQDTATRDDPLG